MLGAAYPATPATAPPSDPADHLAGRPGHVREPRRETLLERARLGGLGEHRQRRREADAGPERGDEQRRDDDADNLRGRDPEHPHGGDREPGDERRAAADPVRVAAGERRERRPRSPAPTTKPPAITRVAAAEVVDPQWDQHLDRAEHQRGDRDEGGRRQHRPGDDRRRGLGEASASPGRADSGVRQTSTANAGGDPEHGAEDDLGADLGGKGAQRRADQGAGDGGAERGADHRAAALGRRSGDQPGQRPRPDQGAGDALDEARGVEQHDALAEAEDDAGDPEQRQAGEHRAPRARPGWRAVRPAARRAACPPRRRPRGSPLRPC